MDQNERTLKNRLRDLDRFVAPLLIQFVATYLIRLTDKAIVGRISTPAFNAVNLASSTLFVVAGVLGAITIILNVRGGKKLGEEDREGFDLEFETSIFLSILIGLFAFVVILFSQRWILSVFYALEGDPLEQGILFFTPMSLYVLLQLLIFAFTTYFKLHGQTKLILVGATASSLINVGIDYLFALGSFGLPRLGVKVVGWSTIFAMALNLGYYIFILRKEIRFCLGRYREYFKNAMLHLKMSLAIMMQEVLDGTLMVLALNALIIRIGEKEFAGYSIIMESLGFLFLFKYIYGSAVLSLTSIGRGKRDREELLDHPKIATWVTTALYIGAGLLLLIFRQKVPAIISDDLLAQQAASRYLPYFLLAYLFSQGSYIYRCALQSMEEYRFVLYATAPVNLVSALLILYLTQKAGRSLEAVALAQFLGECAICMLYHRKYIRSVRSI